LDQVLAHHGINRSDVYVDNACACRPRDNRTPTAIEVSACKPRLLEELDQRPIGTIVALGNTATHVFLPGGDKITQLRVGPPRIIQALDGKDRRLIPTIHPAACLRAGDFFPSLVTDIGKIRGGADGTVAERFRPPAYKVYDQEEEAEKVLVLLMERYDEFVIDIEVGIEKDTDFDHPERYGWLAVGIGFERGRVCVIGEKALTSRRVRLLIGELVGSNRIIAHNGKFDLAGLSVFTKAYNGTIGKLFFDTMLASYVIDERPGTHGLKYLGAEHLGAPDWDSELHQHHGKGESFAVVPRPILYKYNAYDVHATWLLYEQYREQLAQEGLRGLHDFLCELAVELIHLEMEGLGVDQEYLTELETEYIDRIAGLDKELSRWVANPRSPKQVMEALAQMGFKVSTTDEDMLRKLLARTNDEDTQDFLELMLTSRRTNKLYGTYVKGTRKRLYDGRVFPTFLLHGTVTGRLACRNPNLFNVPRESSIRALFAAGPGKRFVQADYATIELRAMAVEAEDDTLGAIFREGRDIHNEFSRIFYGDNFTKDQRVRTKAFVFGSAYGREAYSIAQEHGIPVHEAERIQKTFFDAMPGVVAYRERITHQVLHDQADLVTRFGRRRRFWLITRDNQRDAVKEGLAFIPQSTASDINMHALIKLRRAGMHLRVPVYDSQLVECDAADAEDVAREMERIMEETATELMGDFIPFPVDVKIGNNWGEV
jgi:uracil-DNA glycosylase family 4